MYLNYFIISSVNILFLDVKSCYIFSQALGTFQECEARYTVIRNRYFSSHSQVRITESTHKFSNNYTTFQFTKFTIKSTNARRQECTSLHLSAIKRYILCIPFMFQTVSHYEWTFLINKASKRSFVVFLLLLLFFSTLYGKIWSKSKARIFIVRTR